MGPGLSVTVTEESAPGGGVETHWDFPPEKELLERILQNLFSENYREIVFGPCVQGSVFEVTTKRPPKKIAYLDGYLTVDFGDWHLHLCIGEHRGLDAAHPCPEELARWRRCGRAALVRTFTPGPDKYHPPASYRLVLWNGRGEQMITIFFPNPWLDEKFRLQEAPDWSRLRLWNEIRTAFLGMAPDPGSFE